MATATLPKPPANEIGITTPNPLPSWGLLSRAGVGAFMDDTEDVDALRWPTSVRETFPRMRNDTQLKALFGGTVLLVTRFAWGVDPNGARPTLVDDVCREFNLLRIDDAIAAAETGDSPVPIGRTKNRFSFAKHQTEALKALELGHAFFEQVGTIGDDGRWHLRKLAPRPQRSITEIRVADDGGLVSIKQQVGLESPEIPVDRLVAYAWDADPGSWIGRSMYRACYREWLIKDRLLRVDAANHESLGGSTILEAAKGATKAEIAELAGMATQIRSGLGGGGAVPNGVTPHPMRAGGGPTTIESINRHDEAMARPFFLMVVQLGSTQTGSRALGGTFSELMGAFQEGVAIWFRDVFNEHVIEDYVDWNYGPDEEFVPRLVFRRPAAAPPPTAGVDQIAEQSPGVAAALEDVKREVGEGKHRRPARTTRRQPAARTAAESVLQPLPLPSRTLRREPYEHEVRAQVDFATVDRNWQATVDDLVAGWQQIRAGQIAELEALVAAARADLGKLAAIAATPAGASVISDRLKQMAADGAAEAVAEAGRQGVTITAPELTATAAELEQRAGALEQLLARSLSEAAARKAVQLTGGALVPLEVATEVRAHLESLTDTYLVDQFGGAASAAQNAGRMAVFGAGAPALLYASELLDVNTCEPCRLKDGQEYQSTEDAAVDYPAGGYHACLGGPRCRGTVVAVYDEAAASSVSAAAAAADAVAFEQRVTRLVRAQAEQARADLAQHLATLQQTLGNADSRTRDELARLADSIRGRDETAAASAQEQAAAIRAEIAELAAATDRRFGQIDLAAVSRETAAAVAEIRGEIRGELARLAERAVTPDAVEAVEKRLGDIAGLVSALAARPVERPQPRPRSATTRRAADGSVEVTYHYPDEGGR